MWHSRTPRSTRPWTWVKLHSSLDGSPNRQVSHDLLAAAVDLIVEVSGFSIGCRALGFTAREQLPDLRSASSCS